MVSASSLFIRGIVQGVGFRPTVYTYAIENHLAGWVKNTSAGVEILVEGDQKDIDNFVLRLKLTPPPLAKIDQFILNPAIPTGEKAFVILDSRSIPGDYIPISPDISICPDCVKELFDSNDRRFRYSFINCTNCGPRFTIIRDIPYDRPLTTMADFKMCPQCQAEYNNPSDRRFHAQPIACPICGPQLWYETDGKVTHQGEEALQMARKDLVNGKIIAIKGLGGYLLACDASNLKTVNELRKRKNRSQKPFALMAWDLDSIKKYCHVSSEEAELLSSHHSPIVLLEKIPCSHLPAEIAPRQRALGFMLPYTPLHLLLLEPELGFPEVLVMTSGNQSEEPIAYIDEDARNHLVGLADGFLMHNRPIEMRTDDSVTRVIDHQPYLIRRARGYTPLPVQLPINVIPILATGGQMKNAFCLTRDRYAFMSHHIGEMENQETLESFENGITHFERMFRVNPELFACDNHPDYLASRYARDRACQEQTPLIEVQHHHAHLASVLVDNGWNSDQPVIGLCFDGTGYGIDGAIWGGEFLVGNYKSFNRVSHLEYLPLPGGDAATLHTSRIAAAYLWSAGIKWDASLPPFVELNDQEKSLLAKQLEQKINTPLTSSMGRLFDAVSSLIGICQYSTYEGQAAIELEAAIDPDESGSYPFEINLEGNISISTVLKQIIHDLRNNIDAPRISARFHNGLLEMMLSNSLSIRKEEGIDTVALSGGVWQNRYLLENGKMLLEKNGFHVLWHHQVPANDGGLALGQSIIAFTQMDR